jgi:hypothetical protein
MLTVFVTTVETKALMRALMMASRKVLPEIELMVVTKVATVVWMTVATKVVMKVVIG